MKTYMSEEASERLRDLTRELLELAHDEVEKLTPDSSESMKMFGWYQIVVQMTQYILTIAHGALLKTEE